MRRSVLVVFAGLVLVGAMLFIGCSAPVTLVHVQSFEAKSTRVNVETAFNRLTGVLIDRGYDIKFSNKDAGIVTTEYKQFASIGGDPPFDYYIQIKISIREKTGGELSVKMTPLVKGVNRLNVAAYTEYELSYYTGKPENVRMIKSMKPDGWRNKAQTMFMNVVTDVAEILGISVDDIEKHVTETPKNAITAN